MYIDIEKLILTLALSQNFSVGKIDMYGVLRGQIWTEKWLPYHRYSDIGIQNLTCDLDLGTLPKYSLGKIDMYYVPCGPNLGLKMAYLSPLRR